MIDEHAILKAVAEGDVNAFSSLFYAHHQQLGAYVFSITKSNEITEEIIQDVFLKLWQTREKLKSINNIKLYLYTITKNQTLNAIRKLANEKKRWQQFEHDVLHTESEFVTTVPEDNELEKVFEYAVSSLPPQQQKVFLLRQQGLKNAQIAIEMQISPHSAKKYQQLALQSIEKILRAKAIVISILFYFF